MVLYRGQGVNDDDGYFWFIGRDDDVIKSSGYRIGPFEVESALIEHPVVQEAAVVGSPDVIRGLIFKAFVVLRPGFNPSEKLIKELQNYVKRVNCPVQVSQGGRIRGRTSKDNLRKDQEKRIT